VGEGDGALGSIIPSRGAFFDSRASLSNSHVSRRHRETIGDEAIQNNKKPSGRPLDCFASLSQ
jgi:hypothetical protein